MPNSTCAAPPIRILYDNSTCRHDCEVISPEVAVDAGTAVKNKRPKRDSFRPIQFTFSGPPKYMGANPPADHENETRTAAIMSAIANASAAAITAYGPKKFVSESKMKEPKICGRCPKIVRDTPALKRHCSEVHKQDIDGKPISIELFPCPVTTCLKYTNPFKRREKLAHHIRTSHKEIIKGKEVYGGISSGEKDATLTTNDTAEAGNDFGGNHGAARVSARAHHDSTEGGVWYHTVFEELLSPHIELQSAPVAMACETSLCYPPNIPVDANFQPSSTLEKCNGDTTDSFLNSASMNNFWDSPPGVDLNRTAGDAAEIPTLAHVPNEGALDLDGVIDPALLQSFPSGGELLNRSSPSALPGLSLDLFRQIATGGRAVAADQTVTVEYDTIHEAKQALLDAREKTLQKLQFINQQIENLEGRKQNRSEAVGGLESVEGSFL